MRPITQESQRVLPHYVATPRYSHTNFARSIIEDALRHPSSICDLDRTSLSRLAIDIEEFTRSSAGITVLLAKPAQCQTVLGKSSEVIPFLGVHEVASTKEKDLGIGLLFTKERRVFYLSSGPVNSDLLFNLSLALNEFVKCSSIDSDSWKNCLNKIQKARAQLATGNRDTWERKLCEELGIKYLPNLAFAFAYLGLGLENENVLDTSASKVSAELRNPFAAAYVPFQGLNPKYGAEYEELRGKRFLFGIFQTHSCALAYSSSLEIFGAKVFSGMKESFGELAEQFEFLKLLNPDDELLPGPFRDNEFRGPFAAAFAQLGILQKSLENLEQVLHQTSPTIRFVGAVEEFRTTMLALMLIHHNCCVLDAYYPPREGRFRSALVRTAAGHVARLAQGLACQLGDQLTSTFPGIYSTEVALN